MLFGFRSNDVDVFETRLPIQPQIRQILAEKTEALAKKENSNQRQNDDGNERIAAEESSDC